MEANKAHPSQAGVVDFMARLYSGLEVVNLTGLLASRIFGV